MARRRVHGVGKLVKKLNLIGKISNEKMEEMIDTALEKGKKSAERKAPVRTGEMKESINIVKFQKVVGGKVQVTAKSKKGVYYPIFIEHGTKHGIKPHGFIKRGRGAAMRSLRKDLKLLASQIQMFSMASHD